MVRLRRTVGCPLKFFKVVLPKDISKLVNLSQLWLRDNLLSTLPDEIVTLPNLKRLVLQNNHLKALPDNLKEDILILNRGGTPVTKVELLTMQNGPSKSEDRVRRFRK